MLKRTLSLAVLALAVTGCATVGTGYRGVTLSWGKPTGEIKTEGISFLMPFSGYDVIPMNVQTQAANFTTSAASKDLQTVKTDGVVNYHLDPGQVINIYDRLRNDYQERVLDPTVSEAVKAATARFAATDLISHRNEVVTQVETTLRKQMAPFGIVIEQVLITNFSFDPTFQQSVEAKVAAQQDLLTAKITAQKAQAEAVGVAAAQQAQRTTLTPALLQKAWIDKWDGHLPAVSGGNTPLIQLPQGAEKD